ncbi:MAG: inner-membrane translocator [Chloroflexota bacterium]|nr:MAG: inner-membrane translocator [Chloroflexota bacterium]
MATYVQTTPPAASTKKPRMTRHRLFELLAGDLRILPVLIALLAIWFIFASLSPVFVSSRNITNLFMQSVVTGIIALAIIPVLIVGEIDLSIAAISGLCGTLTAQLTLQLGWPPMLAVAAAILVGVTIGLIQGVWITRSGAPSFLVTFGGSLALGGAQMALLPKAGNVNLLGSGLEFIAGEYLPASIGFLFAIVAALSFGLLRHQTFREKQKLGTAASLSRQVVAPAVTVGALCAVAVAILNQYRGVPLAALIFFVLLAIFAYVTTQTKFGLYMFAIGGSVESARRAAIPVLRIKTAAFMIAGGLSAIAGIVAASRLIGVSVGLGGGTLLLEGIAAAVIGGTSLFGGRGTVWAALLGALVIGSISNGMDLLGMSTEIKMAVTGGILVLATTIDAVISRGSLLSK